MNYDVEVEITRPSRQHRFVTLYIHEFTTDPEQTEHPLQIDL